MKIERVCSLAVLLILPVIGSGCGGQQSAGEIITIQAPGSDTVAYQAVLGNTPCYQGNDGGIVNMPPGPGLTEVGPISGNTDDTPYTIASTTDSPTACYGQSNVVQCGAVITLTCNPVPSNAAQGTFTVSGGQDDAVCYYSRTDIQSGPCPGPPGSGGKTIYNSGTVSVTFDGQTISARYGQTSTALGLAGQMALALYQNSVLSSQFVSAANGSVGIVHALNSGTQYDYAWTSSCSYNTLYFHWCSFTVGLSPAGSLQSPQ